MPVCEGIVPEHTYPVRSEVQVDADGNAVKDEHGQVVKIIVTETTPAHPCDAEATMLARSMREIVTAETTREDGSTVQMLAWERVADHCYCSSHFVPGTMTHADGRVTQHPAMAVSDV